MNINEHMNQLGQIGSVGYAPTEAMIDDLLSRTKRARAVRQGSAAVVGSVSAVALGIVGAQIYVTIDHRNDAATQDRNLIEEGIFNFDSQYGSGYTGIDQASKEAFEKIYEDLNLAAQIEAKHLAEKQAAEAAAAAAAAGETKTGGTTSCVYEEHEWNGGTKYRGPETNCQWVYPDEPPSEVPAGWIDFGGTLGQCKNYYDTASGKTIWAAFIDAGSSYKKIVKCEGGPTDYWSGSYHYVYNGPEGGGWHATISGTTCTGYTATISGAPHMYSCNPNKDYWIPTDPTHYKWFEPDCRYYNISSPPSGWYWNGSAWAEVIVTPPPDPDPTPTPTATGSA